VGLKDVDGMASWPVSDLSLVISLVPEISHVLEVVDDLLLLGFLSWLTIAGSRGAHRADLVICSS
jgi:hypothetical protein